MIGEIRSGSSFRGLTHYLLHGSGEHLKTPEWVELRNLFETDPERAYQEMHSTASQSSRVKDPVFHVVLSPAPGDRFSREDWRALAERVLGDLGLGEHQAMVALHTDTAHPHLHLAINRVHPQTLRAWDRWQSKTRLEAILREVEREWGLRVVSGRLAGAERSAGRGSRPPALSRGEQAQLHQRASEPQVLAWRRELRGAFEGATSWTDLAARLQVHGVHLVARGRGMVATDGEVYVKLSRLDRGWSRGRLEARFGGFAEWRREMRRFEEAARLYPRYAARAPHHPRARAAVRTLERAGRRLGWRSLARLRGPLSPAVSAVALAARRRARAFDREERGDWASFVRAHLGPALGRSGSWAEAESRLGLYGAWLAPVEGGSRGLVVTDGRHATPVGDLGPGFGVERLEARLGSWREWESSRRALLAAARRYQRVEASEDAALVRYRRMVGLIGAAERRVERYERLHGDYRRAEARLRGLLRRETGRSAAAIDEVLRAVRSGAVEGMGEVIGSARSRRLGIGRRRSHAGEVLLEAAREYRALAERVSRSAPPARSAARRLERLRRQARLANPHLLRQRQRRVLESAVRPLLGSGVRSLVARAVPGLGPALTVVRLLGRLHRDLSRGADRSR